MKVYIIHYKVLTNRKETILYQLQQNNITNYEFVECFDDKYKYKFDDNYKEAMLSLTSKHFTIYKKIAENDECALILEDDVILNEDFSNILNKYVAQLPSDYDMLFLGDGCGYHIEKDRIKEDIYVYEKCLYPTNWGGDGATRCTDSYIMSKKCAIKLSNYIDNLNYKITLNSDWWLNVAARDNNFKVYWAEPTIIINGSIRGYYKTEMNN